MANRRAVSFQDELQEVLDEVNARRPYADRVTFRAAVVNGMTDNEGNQLRDSFTSKIKAGSYRPTFDRLRNLAKYLGVPPSRFQTYKERYATKMIEENALAQELFSLLSEQTDQVADLLLQAAVKRMREVLTAAISKKPDPVAA